MSPLLNLSELRRLVTEIDALDDAAALGVTQRREDLQYTLCISTGVREPRLALERARFLLAQAATSDDSPSAQVPTG